MRIKAGLENDKSVFLQLLRFQSLFWFDVATKEEVCECCLQDKRVLKHLILAIIRGDRPSSYHYLKWLKTALLEGKRMCKWGLFFISLAFVFNRALLSSEKITVLLWWPKIAT